MQCPGELTALPGAGSRRRYRGGHDRGRQRGIDVRRIVIDGGPNAIIWTHADQVNQALLDFIPRPGTTTE